MKCWPGNWQYFWKYLVTNLRRKGPHFSHHQPVLLRYLKKKQKKIKILACFCCKSTQKQNLYWVKYRTGYGLLNERTKFSQRLILFILAHGIFQLWETSVGTLFLYLRWLGFFVTHSFPIHPFFPPLKTNGFLTFSGGRERVHWEQKGLSNYETLIKVSIKTFWRLYPENSKHLSACTNEITRYCMLFANFLTLKLELKLKVPFDKQSWPMILSTWLHDFF